MFAILPSLSRPCGFAAAVLALLGLLSACAGGLPGLERNGQPSTEAQRATGAAAEEAEADASEAAMSEADRTDDRTDPAAASYHLNPQDALRIFVWGEEELQREAAVQPDGSISFPLVGQVAAAGRTVDEVQAEIAERLDRFIPDAVVTVELLQASGSKIYVMGEVNHPGEYPLTGPLSIVQAISRAGGFTNYAATGRIRILRRGEGEGTAMTVDYDRIASGRDPASNIDLKAGDTIIVPGSSLF